MHKINITRAQWNSLLEHWDRAARPQLQKWLRSEFGCSARRPGLKYHYADYCSEPDSCYVILEFDDARLATEFVLKYA